MLDLLAVVIVIAFFAACSALISASARIIGDEQHDEIEAGVATGAGGRGRAEALPTTADGRGDVKAVLMAADDRGDVGAPRRSATTGTVEETSLTGSKGER